MNAPQPLYAGDGSTVSVREAKWPERIDHTSLTDPAGYLADPGLADAVNVALTLRQPLLVTGEPGTGKTQLASSIAHELQLPPPLTSYTKSTTTVRDLFYTYDSLRHFHDAQFQSSTPTADSYIEYNALGLAILLGMPAAEADPFLPPDRRGQGPTRSVVLIDEIDKAPRDVPNDMLNELEEMAFTVKETRRTYSAEDVYRPIVVITSNSEKNLPDAFLRRCVFYHIPFPDRERLRRIVERRLPTNGSFTGEKINNAIEHFEEIRKLNLRKPPATAELLGWLRILHDRNIDVKDPGPSEREVMALTYSVLAKSREDLSLMKREMS
jgi:MoxR-like ATPase